MVVVAEAETFLIGADYDMSECSPGELDPHAVASVFKAYLRERESNEIISVFCFCF